MTTRDRILKAAWEIIVAKGDDALTMGSVAQASGLSRQALYLHFKDRADLLVELVVYGDQQSGRADWRHEIELVEGGVARLRALVTNYQERASRLSAVIRPVESARYRDVAAATAHSRRIRDSRVWADRFIVQILREEGRIHESWTSAEAVAIILNFINFRAWDDFTSDYRWSRQRFIDVATSAILGSLAAPVDRRSTGRRVRR